MSAARWAFASLTDTLNRLLPDGLTRIWLIIWSALSCRFTLFSTCRARLLEVATSAKVIVVPLLGAFATTVAVAVYSGFERNVSTLAPTAARTVRAMGIHARRRKTRQYSANSIASTSCQVERSPSFI